MLVPSPGRAGPRESSVATSALLGSRSEKVRIQAALVLGRRRDVHAVPDLIHGLADISPIVRAMVAQALGQIGDEAARPGLEVAVNDKAPLVRRHAVAALEALAASHSNSTIDVKPMGDRTNRASPQLRNRMRQAVTSALRGFKKHAAGGLAVDGSIKTLGTSTRADLVEVKCAVELILSTGRGSAIVMMSSGEAIVQKQKRHYRPAMQSAMEQEALENAVRGASDELREHFAANGF
ncbi:MAG TPA: HEAT repeat domain-containing protein [Polyangia bacterium]|jgi:HEAT repeat protein